MTRKAWITEALDRPQRWQRTGPDHDRSRRQPLVHRAGREQDRADHTSRGDHRVLHWPLCRESASRYHSGPRWQPWFTEWNGCKIGRITTAGVITQFAYLGEVDPEGITQGPDGNLWFTEYGANKIGRITTAGVATQFSGLTAGGYPQYITAGSDGNLWATEGEGNKIARITTAGVITEYTAGLTAKGFPAGIAAGPDGNLWIAEASAGKVARLTIGGPVDTVLPTISGAAQQGQR